jgi:hypothetical protein
VLHLLLLMPLAVVGIWTSVRVSNATELAYYSSDCRSVRSQ